MPSQVILGPHHTAVSSPAAEDADRTWNFITSVLEVAEPTHESLEIRFVSSPASYLDDVSVPPFAEYCVSFIVTLSKVGVETVSPDSVA